MRAFSTRPRSSSRWCWLNIGNDEQVCRCARLHAGGGVPKRDGRLYEGGDIADIEGTGFRGTGRTSGRVSRESFHIFTGSLTPSPRPSPTTGPSSQGAVVHSAGGELSTGAPSGTTFYTGTRNTTTESPQETKRRPQGEADILIWFIGKASSEGSSPSAANSPAPPR